MDANCQRCHEPISEQAIQCKHCGYEPSNAGWKSWAVALAGFALCLTGIGAILGIPMIWGAISAEKEMKDYRPANHKPT